MSKKKTQLVLVLKYNNAIGQTRGFEIWDVSQYEYLKNRLLSEGFTQNVKRPDQTQFSTDMQKWFPQVHLIMESFSKSLTHKGEVCDAMVWTFPILKKTTHKGT